MCAKGSAGTKRGIMRTEGSMRRHKCMKGRLTDRERRTKRTDTKKLVRINPASTKNRRRMGRTGRRTKSRKARKL